ncbi:MAG TPA: LysR family transcriptional regulator [Polyangiales bacterium]|nr:LysR family transcriptional regulator [Polyangiales bacterium]
MKLSDIDLNLLVVLEAVLSERSVTAAARRVGLSQPATSAALRRLRVLFDDPLLERVGARWRLTAFAHDLAEPLQGTMAAIDATINRRFTFDPATSHRRFGIAAADDVACVLVQPLLERLEQIAPNVKVLVTGPDVETSERLMKRQLDLSIVPDGYRSRGFMTEKLYRDSWVVACWTGNTRVGQRLTREQFVELGHVTVASRPYAFTLVERTVGALSQKLNVQVVSESFSSLALLLRGSQRIALMPGRLAAKLKAAAEIRILAPPVPLNDLVFAMAWPALHARDAGHAWFRQTITEVAAQLEGFDALAQAM